MARITAEEISGERFKKFAKHSISVPLYSSLAGIESVFTIVTFSLIEPTLMSKNCPAGDPFTLQFMKASEER